MKALYSNIVCLLIVLLITSKAFAQPGHGVKQPPKINGISKVISNANINARIHANSNSVFGTSKIPATDKKVEPKKSEIKEEADTKKTKSKKQKK